MIEDQDYIKFLALADTLYGLGPEQFEQGSYDDLSRRGVQDWGDFGASRPAKFNMAFLNGYMPECGSVCCAIGWGYSMFGTDWNARGPSQWAYSMDWASIKGADTPQAAAHRIWFWLWTGTGSMAYCSDAGWAQFVLEYPILECRKMANAREIHKSAD